MVCGGVWTVPCALDLCLHLKCVLSRLRALRGWFVVRRVWLWLSVLSAVALMAGVVSVPQAVAVSGGGTKPGSAGGVGGVVPWRGVPAYVPAVKPAKARPSVGKRIPVARRVRELTGKRSANSSVFRLADGRTQAEVSSTPVHYRDAAGKWRNIDPAVRPASASERAAGFGAANHTNAFASAFGVRSDRLARFDLGGVV